MSKIKDITGQIFGRLFVIKLDHTDKGRTYWLCECECGNKKVILGTALTSNRTVSCGCYGIEQRRKATFIDLTGQRFERLTVIRFSHRIGTAYFWLCKCDCGNEKIIAGGSLRKGKTRSCGCLQSELVSLDFGESSFNYLFSSYKNNAKKRGFLFDLDREYFKYLTRQNCHYCGIEPSQIYALENGKGQYTYNGIDRKNSKLGYTKDNCVSCCSFCNVKKSDTDYDVFISWIEKIYNRLIKNDQR